MNKRKIIFVILCITLLFAGCDKSDSDKSTVTTKPNVEQTTTTTATTKITTNNIEEDVCEIYTEDDEGDFAKHIFDILSDKNAESSSYLTNSTGQNGIYVYSLSDIEGYSLFNKYEAASCYVYSTYHSDYLTNARSDGFVNEYTTLQNTILFTWAFGFCGPEISQEAMQGDINYWESEGYTVNEIANMSGYYYADFGIYQKIFWCEDGYSFELQIPTSVGSVNATTHEYSGEDVFTLQKTFYPFDDNTVAE